MIRLRINFNHHPKAIAKLSIATPVIDTRSVRQVLIGVQIHRQHCLLCHGRQIIQLIGGGGNAGHIGETPAISDPPIRHPQVENDARVCPPRRIVGMFDIFISANWYPVALGRDRPTADIENVKVRRGSMLQEGNHGRKIFESRRAC
ncbi:hypothetical protein M5524_22630 [Duganella sp. BuS-21]